MHIDFLLQRFRDHLDDDAIIWRGKPYSYGWLLNKLQSWSAHIESEGVEPGTVVTVEADFSPASVALLLALVGRGCVIVPLTSSVALQKARFTKIAQGEISFTIDDHDGVQVNTLPHTAAHPLYQTLRQRQHPGLVLFSSGSTGESKAAVHDLVDLMQKFKVQRHSLRTIAFLLYDHIGGFNTMLYTLSNAGCMITVQDRSPDAVLSAIEKHRVELLPTSPTFINLMLISEAYKRHDLATLKTVTYGTEPMPESTLRRFHNLFPGVRLLQTYGLSELGILRSKSRSSDSLWVKIGGEGFQTRVVEGILEIKAQSAMLGYLNAPSPFTDDGWFHTGDEVEVDGEYLRILGRRSEVINTGGEKVHPAEVESVIQEFPNVSEVTVYGEKNPIVGSIVCARVTPANNEDDAPSFINRIKAFCHERLERHKVPVKIQLVKEKQHTNRFKKARHSQSVG